MSTVRVPPNAQFIRALCAQNLTHQKALCEWIDNSLDAGATTVRVVYGTGVVSVEDDGAGSADLIPFAKVGESKRHRTTRSGMYGIGSKDAALWYGGERCVQKIESFHGGKRRHLQIDWARMANHDWEIDAPVELVPEIPKTGTLIEVRPCTHAAPCGAEWKKLLADLGYIYAAAIRNRRVSISLKARRQPPDVLVPWELPPLVAGSVIDAEIEVGGRRAMVHAGMVESGVENKRPGLTYHHGFRVIIPASGRGCGEGEWRKIAGYVLIDDSWSRTKNKDDIQRAGDLYAAVERAIAPLLALADKSGMELRHDALNQTVADRVNAAMGQALPDAKAVRGPRRSHGLVEPKNTGRKHTRAAVEQAGSTFGGRAGRSGSIRIAWAPMSDGAVGRLVGPTVELNELNPYLACLKETDNADAIALLVFSLLAYLKCHGSQLATGGLVFERVLGAMCERPGTLDGRPLSLVRKEAV